MVAYFIAVFKLMVWILLLVTGHYTILLWLMSIDVGLSMILILVDSYIKQQDVKNKRVGV